MSALLCATQGTWVFVVGLRNQQRIDFKRTQLLKKRAKAEAKAAKLKRSPALFDGDLDIGDRVSSDSTTATDATATDTAKDLEFLDEYIDPKLIDVAQSRSTDAQFDQLDGVETLKTHFLMQDAPRTSDQASQVTLCLYVP
jgi:hypothetical protein